jgi:hypothetical protein
MESGHTKTNYARKSLIKFVRLGGKSVKSAGRQTLMALKLWRSVGMPIVV